MAIAMAVALLAITFAALLLWPAPAQTLRCAADDQENCIVASGRVLYALQKDRADHRRPLHLVLASRDSRTAPLITVLKIPPNLRPASNPHVGAWVSARGAMHRGSNGQPNLGVTALRCGGGDC